MFLGIYHFDGEPTALIPGYERLMAGMPPENITLHVCVVREGGLSVYDACPSKEVFASFSTGPDFAAAARAAGLPAPRVEQLGEVHAAQLQEAVRT
jgi:hypothetical protein